MTHVNGKTKKKIKFRCGHCGKEYKRHSLFDKHYAACTIKHNLKKAPIAEEKEIVTNTSLNRKLNRILDVLYVQSERLKTVEKLLESKNTAIKNKLKWLTDNVTPPHSLDNCLKNTSLNTDHYKYITQHGYTKGYCDLVEEIITPYSEMIYSFTTTHKTYIYENKKVKWVEFTKQHARRLFSKIQQHLIKVALTVSLPENIQLENNLLIYGTNYQSIDIRAKIKTHIHKNTLISIETLLNKYED